MPNVTIDINLIIIAIVTASSVWVYLDAVKNKIGTLPRSRLKSIFNISAGEWAIATLIFWIIGFPSYLIKRRALIEIAKKNPIEATGYEIKALALSLVGVAGIIIAINISSTPSCDSSRVKNFVEEEIHNRVKLLEILNVKFITIKNIIDNGYNSETKTRSCSAMLVTTMGEDDFVYVIKKANKDGEDGFYVEISL